MAGGSGCPSSFRQRIAVGYAREGEDEKMKYAQVTILQPPALDIDKIINKGGVNVIGKVERRIVWNLLHHLNVLGWKVRRIISDDEESVVDPKSAVEKIFNLDDCTVGFCNIANVHRGVKIVLGNEGSDCISDWGYTIGDADGFNAAMEAFDAEAFV